MQAKDITDDAFIGAVDGIVRRTGRWAVLTDLHEALGEEIPTKVVLAKARKLIKRGVVSGCSCGCYGGFEIVWTRLVTAGYDHPDS